MERYRQIFIQDLSTSSIKRHYLLIYNGHYYEASWALVELLTCLQNSSTKEEAIWSYMEKKQNNVSYVQVEKLILGYIDPILLLCNKEKTFLYQKELLSVEQINKSSNKLCFLFQKKFVIPTILITIICDVLFFLYTSDLFVFNNCINIYVVLGLLFFVFLSSILHEIGHASACKFYGVLHGGIGFGIYLNIPVLFTDVTDIWRLKRTERCVVNVAGVYFQSFLLISLVFIFGLTESAMVKYMIITLNFGFLMTLNPFFKFDGYWIVSDLLGIPNLRERSKEWLYFCYKRFRKLPISDLPYIYQLSFSFKIYLFVYTISVNLFLGYYLFYIIPMFIKDMAKSFLSDIERVVLYLSNNIEPPFVLIRNVLMQIIFILLISVFVINLVRKIYHAKLYKKI